MNELKKAYEAGSSAARKVYTLPKKTTLKPQAGPGAVGWKEQSKAPERLSPHAQ